MNRNQNGNEINNSKLVCTDHVHWCPPFAALEIPFATTIGFTAQFFCDVWFQNSCALFAALAWPTAPSSSTMELQRGPTIDGHLAHRSEDCNESQGHCSVGNQLRRPF